MAEGSLWGKRLVGGFGGGAQRYRLLLMVVSGEPHGLAEVRALAGYCRRVSGSGLV